MKTVLLAVAICAAIAYAGGAIPAEAHSILDYYPIVVDILEYDVTEYNGFNLVRMNLSIENLADFTMSSPGFTLGGAPEYVNDPVEHPDTAIKDNYYHSTYAEVRSRGGDVTTEDCTSADRFNSLISGNTGETTVCFMAGKLFKPDGLLIAHWGPGSAHPVNDSGNCDTAYDHESHACISQQVIPFHDDSVYCFDTYVDRCNADNVQRVDGTPAPRPEQESEQDSAELLHALYNNRTGTLTLMFNQLVVAHSPDHILLIHDIDAFIENGAATSLDGAKLNTAGDKRQSAILAFTLSDALRLQVTQSLRDQADLALLIDTRAVYAAEGFVPIQPILVPDVTVVRGGPE